MATYLYINEIFGPTIQGEGLNSGASSVFLRLAGCNLACVWCDTRYAWDWSPGSEWKKADESHPMTASEVMARIGEMAGESVRRLVVTGGEPMLQQRALVPLLADLTGWQVEIETAGTIPVARPIVPLVGLWTISPKLASSGNGTERVQHKALASFPPSATAYKFVIGGDMEADLAEADGLVAEYRPAHVICMPEGINLASQIEGARRLLPAILERGWRLSLRTHILLHGNRRGV